MKQLKTVFANSSHALKFVDDARQSGLYLWDCDALERDILLNYSKPLPLNIKNTKTWYWDTDADEQFLPWIEWMVLRGYEFKIRSL